METSIGGVCLPWYLALGIWLLFCPTSNMEIKCIPPSTSSCLHAVLNSAPRELLPAAGPVPPREILLTPGPGLVGEEPGYFGENPVDNASENFTEEKTPCCLSKNDSSDFSVESMESRISHDHDDRNTVKTFQPKHRNISNSNATNIREVIEKRSSSSDLPHHPQQLSHPESPSPHDNDSHETQNSSIAGASGSYKSSVLSQHGVVGGGFRNRRRRRKRRDQLDDRGSWSGYQWPEVEEEEDGVPTSGQQDFKLTSSTFSLSGDSAHNQAMVHWSGQNSSVILMLTKYLDFNTGSVTESSLWRSTDYGTTYEKLNEKVGLKTILSYLYVSPNDKNKIMLLTDPEVESSLLISVDEGASYQRQRLAFHILSLLFHPEQEDWILAYSQDQKLYVSVEFGRRWQLVHENVVPNRFYWSKPGLDKEPGMIHLETMVSEGRSQYITCRLQNCSGGHRGRPFPGFIIPDSLVVQDEYVFIQVPISGRPVHYVSYKRHTFYALKLPKYTLAKDLQIISTDDQQVVAAVQDWHQNDSYNLFVSDARGLFFTLALEDVVSSRGPEGNVMIDLYEVAGIKGVFLSNKVVENQVKTYITYNKGRDWSLLQAPAIDLHGNRVYCVQPYCSLHLHLHVSENPYTSGNIVSQESAPGIIVASGTVGTELTTSNVSIFITSDAGNTWREVFEEEYSVLFLNQGGGLVAIRHSPLPIRDVWLSFDEGREWNKYSFTSSPLYVDGVLGEPGEDSLIMTIFGHVSHRSEWQLVKIDFRSIFNRKCTSEDYQTWQLQNQGEVCIMGVKRIFQNLQANARCVKTRDQYVSQKTSCPCSENDFECDYGFERQSDGRCRPSFWFVGSSVTRDCSTGDSFVNTTGYRKALSNNCTEGPLWKYLPKRQSCPRQPPRGLSLATGDGTLTTTTATNISFLVLLEEGYGSTTSITVDFGDGTAISYANISSIEDGVKHVYSKVGIYLVSATALNTLGLDRALLYLHVTCKLEEVRLSAPLVTVRNKVVYLTSILKPSDVGTVTYYWWMDNTTEPVVTLVGGMSFTFSQEGTHTVTLQVAVGNMLLQDMRTVTVCDYFRSHILAFSSNLDELNPGVTEWRQDVSRAVKNSMVQVTGVRAEQLLVSVLPGRPTAAELFILPERSSTDQTLDRKGTHLDQISNVLLSALNQDLVQFTLRPGVQINVYASPPSPASLLDSSESRHSGAAVIMLVSVVLMGLALFLIYKFKRRIPGITYTEKQAERDQEVVPAVAASIAVPRPGGDVVMVTSLEHVDLRATDSGGRDYLPSHTAVSLSDEAAHGF